MIWESEFVESALFLGNLSRDFTHLSNPIPRES